MEEKRTLIETFLPVEEISAEAKKEKNGRAPTFELHYWWTRKPLITSRATVLGALLPGDFNVSTFKRMLGLRDDQKKRAHNYDLSKSQLEKLKKIYLNFNNTENPKVLDPFGGGGSIPFEALRVGCNVISNDYNPTANLIQKATVEYPAKYGNVIYKDVEKGLNWIFDSLKKKMENFYPEHNGKKVLNYIYAWSVKCPNCNFENPLVSQWWLVRKGSKKLFLDPTIENNKLKFKIKRGNDAPSGTMKRGVGKCIKCGSTIPNEHIITQINENQKEILLAVVLLGENGKEYDLPNSEDINSIKKIKNELKVNWDNFLKDDLVPIEKIPLGDVRCAKYLGYWYKILNDRQLILIINLIKLIREYGKEIRLSNDFGYSKAVLVYLSFILAKHINRNCRSTTWDRTAEKVVHALTMRSPGMMWDHSEVNPFIKGSGSLPGVNRSILKSLRYSIEKLKQNENILVKNDSIIDIDTEAQIIVTDPPYFDDVVYAELSEFFYVFEKRALRDFIKNQEIPNAEDLSVSRKRTEENFEHLFNLSCQKMHKILSENGLLVMYFAHSSVKAWDFVVNALRDAKFRITATWPIHTESPNNPIARDKASIMSSIVIVARKRKENRIGYIEEIKGDVEEHLKQRLQEFWNYGLRGADITVAAMGASLDILTQYSEIKSYAGEMTVKDILELVEIYVVEYILEKFLKNSESLDSPTRFYTYCRLSELGGMSFDTANLISKSLNIDLKSLKSSGNIKSITTGSKKGIKLLKFDERENIEVKSLIDAVQLSMLAYDKGGMKEFESTLTEVPYGQSEILNILKSFQHLESGDPEKQIALQILGKSADFIPEKGQTTLD